MPHYYWCATLCIQSFGLCVCRQPISSFSLCRCIALLGAIINELESGDRGIQQQVVSLDQIPNTRLDQLNIVLLSCAARPNTYCDVSARRRYESWRRSRL